jgi:hypothetical protein
MNYSKPLILILLIVLSFSAGCTKKSNFKRKIGGVYKGTCVSHIESNGVVWDTTFPAEVTVAWEVPEVHGKDIFTIVSAELLAYAWFKYDRGGGYYTGGGEHAGFLRRTPSVTARFDPKEDQLTCTVTGEFYHVTEREILRTISPAKGR